MRIYYINGAQRDVKVIHFEMRFTMDKFENKTNRVNWNQYYLYYNNITLNHFTKYIM